jgi:hypothetical protein
MTFGWGGIIVLIVLFVLGTAAIAVPRIVPMAVEKRYNRVSLPPPYWVREEVEALHKRLFVADLHADPLLWRRNLLKRYDYGHVDIPRLVEGNVALQVFGVVTKAPKGINFERNDEPTNPRHGRLD